MPNIYHKLTISSPAQKIYQALTTKEGIAGWWVTEVEAGFKEGDEVVLRFSVSPTFVEILELKPNEKVRWFVKEGPDEWIGTEISFELNQEMAETIVRLYHTGWKDETDLYGSSTYNWGYYLTSLKNYVETGTGTPHDPTTSRNE